MPQILRIAVELAEPIPLLDSAFLGWETAGPHNGTFFAASPEDSVAILGPPRVGKTSGLLVPQAMTWNGSLVSTSTKPDVLRATRGRRLEIACQRDGDVYVYAPTEPLDDICGVRKIHWSPTDGCEDPTVCEIRVQKLLGPEKPSEQEFFRQAGATVMRGYFHAAALAQAGMTVIKRWIDQRDVEEPIEILTYFQSQSPAAAQYASALRGIAVQPPETKAGTFGTVQEKLAAIVGNATALANSESTDFDIDRFLLTGSTLYVLSPEDVQRIIAPLVAGLIEAIVSRAYLYASRNPSGRLEPPLMLLLDEVGAIAPLPSLPQMLAQGAGQGVLTVWAGQSISQLEARWGKEQAQSIWGASSQKVIFGNLADAELLEQVSKQYGEYDRPVWPHGSKARSLIAAVATKQAVTPQMMRERRLQVSELHSMPPGTACILAHTPAGTAFQRVSVPPAAVTPPFAAAQAAEAQMQTLIERDPGLSSSHLRDEAFARLLHEILPAAERQRFLKEQAALTRRLQELAGLGPAQRERRLSADPELAREARAAAAYTALSQGEQMRTRRRLLELFGSGRIPHFTFTVVEAPRLAKRPALKREPDRYRMRGPGSP
jgi:type IV secretion system protein VirD4